MRKIGWYDVKTKFKHILRSVAYSGLVQRLFCKIISGYIRLVVLTSKKSFHNLEVVNKLLDDKKPFIGAAWHNRLAISPYIYSGCSKKNKERSISVIASAHGDGTIVGKVMENFNIDVIAGSTRKESDPNKKTMDIANFRKIFKILKTNTTFCITPDGPRGPRFKVGGTVASIAKISGVPIIPTTYSIKKAKILGTWDRFILPFPFSKITFYFGSPIYVPKDASEDNIEKYNQKIEDQLNEICKKADNIVGLKADFS